jgi:glycosyltransferase involved in cell wall biosynthesis
VKKILVINTIYKEKGGEDTNIVDEIIFLKKHYDIKYLEFKNSDKLKLIDYLAFFTTSNRKSNKILKDALYEFKPDIAYVHNTWFKANLGIFRILGKNNVRTYLKIHNFRYFCTKFFLVRNHIKTENFCYMCNLNNTDQKIINYYFKDSKVKSFFMINYGKRYYRLIQKSKIKLLVMTNFHKEFLEKNKFKPQNIHIYPNPIESPDNYNYDQNSNYVVYAGRLSADKGIEELINAWINSNVKSLVLKVIGGGELLEPLKKKYNKFNVDFLGEKEHDSTLKLIEKSRGVITATKMFEGQPRLLCEASIRGIPSLFPKFGGMAEFFPYNYPLTFKQFDYFDLKTKIELFQDSNKLKKISKDIYNFSEKEFTENKLKLSFERIIS